MTDQLSRFVATERSTDTAVSGAVAHWAPSRHARTLCGWDMLYSAGLPRLVAEDEDVLRCPACEWARGGPSVTEPQRVALQRLCERYRVPFDESHYGLGCGLPPGYVTGWVGGTTSTIYVGVSPQGAVSS